MFSLHGTAIGGDIVIGRARVLESRRIETDRYFVPAERIDAELRRLNSGLSVVRLELSLIATQLPADAPSEARALLEVHEMLLNDPMLAEEARRVVREQQVNAEWALTSRADLLRSQFETLDDEYLRERGRDVQQVVRRVLRALGGSGNHPPRVAEPSILVATDIAPADVLTMKHAIGLVIDQGGVHSHTAILARSMNVPTVVGLECACELIRDGDWLILDGEGGVVYVAPDESLLAEYRERQAEAERERTRLRELIHVPARTIDQQLITLSANIELPLEAQAAREAGADGVGLFRTEFLFLNRSDLPTEDEQYEAYRAAVHGMAGRPVTIRTIDVGADKALDDEPAVATNPALGLRGVRYSLAHPSMFLVQLRAILRASAHGPVRLLVPMLAYRAEIDQVMRLIDMARGQLRARGLSFADQVPVGAMIEIPAAALTAELFARRFDFLSIGTNDLIQYTLAIDRADHDVASLYDPFHPAVLQLIATTIRAAQAAGKPVAVCGEMAGDSRATRLLLGMGLRDFSMSASSLLRIKREVLNADAGRLAGKVQVVLSGADSVGIDQALERLRAD